MSRSRSSPPCSADGRRRGRRPHSHSSRPPTFCIGRGASARSVSARMRGSRRASMLCGSRLRGGRVRQDLVVGRRCRHGDRVRLASAEAASPTLSSARGRRRGTEALIDGPFFAGRAAARMVQMVVSDRCTGRARTPNLLLRLDRLSSVITRSAGAQPSRPLTYPVVASAICFLVGARGGRRARVAARAVRPAVALVAGAAHPALRCAHPSTAIPSRAPSAGGGAAAPPAPAIGAGCRRRATPCA